MQLLIAGIIQDRDYFDKMVAVHIDNRLIHYIGPVDPAQRDALFAQALRCCI